MLFFFRCLTTGDVVTGRPLRQRPAQRPTAPTGGASSTALSAGGESAQLHPPAERPAAAAAASSTAAAAASAATLSPTDGRRHPVVQLGGFSAPEQRQRWSGFGAAKRSAHAVDVQRRQFNGRQRSRLARCSLQQPHPRCFLFSSRRSE
jgi:hypothetical protein